MGNLCPICEEGTLEAKTCKLRVHYEDRTGYINSYYSICSYCGSEQANNKEVSANKQEIDNFKFKRCENNE